MGLAYPSGVRMRRDYSRILFRSLPAFIPLLFHYQIRQGTDRHHEIGGSIPVAQHPIILIGKITAAMDIIGPNEGRADASVFIL